MLRISSFARVWIHAALLAGALGLPGIARAQDALRPESLLEYVARRTDLTAAERSAWGKAIKKRFGGAALDRDEAKNVQIAIAKSIVSTAIFMEIDAEKGASAAFEGYRLGLSENIPPPLAIQYQRLVLEGRKPRESAERMAFNFPRYYDDELAPELIAYWEKGLREGTIKDEAKEEVQEALVATRKLMRPLLADKLGLLARLERDRATASGARKEAIDRDRAELEAELRRGFTGVALRPEVLDPDRPAYARLLLQLADLGRTPTESDRALEPTRPPPPPAVAPTKPPAVTPTRPPVARVDPPPSPPSPPPQPRAKKPPSPAQPAPPPAGQVQTVLASAIATWLGTPYVWGGTEKRRGTDCSGFTKGVSYEAFTLELPRVSRDQFRVGQPVELGDLAPGDLVFFDTLDTGGISHVGIYSGAGHFAHASSKSGVTYAELQKPYYQRAYRGARRIIDR